MMGCTATCISMCTRWKKGKQSHCSTHRKTCETLQHVSCNMPTAAKVSMQKIVDWLPRQGGRSPCRIKSLAGVAWAAPSAGPDSVDAGIHFTANALCPPTLPAVHYSVRRTCSTT